MKTHGEVSRTERLDVAIAGLVPELSRARASALVKEGCVTVEGEVCVRPAQKVASGQRIAVDVPPPVPDEAQPQDIDIDVVYEDDAIAVINKHAGLVVHAGAGNPDGTLVNALLFRLDGLSGIGGVQRPGIVHRLDRGTSGLLVVAKTNEAHQHLSAQFAAHTAGRRYLALCHGSPEAASGTIQSQLARHHKDRMRYASTPDPTRGKHAITHWARLAVSGTISLITCTLETGRTHQVRVHMSEAGWPIVGDGMYAPRRVRTPTALAAVIDASGSRPLLHAWQLQLNHPNDERRLSFVAEPPLDFVEALQAVELVVPPLPAD